MDHASSGFGRQPVLPEGTGYYRGDADPARIAFSAPVPGNIVPLRLADHGGKVICQKQSFIAAKRGTRVGLKLIPGLTRSNGSSRARAVMTAMFGGEGFILAAITGPGRVWIQSMPFARLAAQFATMQAGGNVIGELGEEAAVGAGKAVAIGAAGLAGAAITSSGALEEDGVLGSLGKLFGD